MIRLLALLVLGVPATIWNATRIAWAVYRKAANADCVCAEVPRAWSRLMLRIAGVRVEIEAAHNIDPSDVRSRPCPAVRRNALEVGSLIGPVKFAGSLGRLRHSRLRHSLIGARAVATSVRNKCISTP